jgi:hypothetical protein
MQGSTEYVVAGSTQATYESLLAVVRERRLAVVFTDERHLTLTFRPAGAGWRDDLAVRCAVLDAGHGIVKLVLTGVADADGAPVDLGGSPLSLLADVEQCLRAGGSRKSDELVRH